MGTRSPGTQMNTDEHRKTKGYLNFVPMLPISRSPYRVCLFRVHLCSSVSPAFCPNRPLAYGFEEADGAGGGGVEGFDGARHRDARPHLRRAEERVAQAGALVAHDANR